MATVKKSKKKIIIPICIVLVIAIVAGTVFGVVKSNSGIEASLYTIGTDDIYETVSVTGDVSSGAKKEYKVSTVATVKEVFVETGDEVKEGDVLATFDTTSLDSQISSLQSAYDEALSSYNQAVKSQKSASTKADALADEISSLEKQIAKLEKAVSNTTTTTTKKATTTTSTTKKATTTKKTTTTKKATTTTAKATTTTKAATTASTTTTAKATTTTTTTKAATTSSTTTTTTTTTERTGITVNTVALPSSYGTVTGAGTYQLGDEVTLTAYSNSGYEFVCWYTSGGEQVTTNPLTISLNEDVDVTYIAYFKAESTQSASTKSASATSGSVTLNATVLPSSNYGSVSGTGTYSSGDTATLTATANDGYKFVCWYTSDGTQVTNNPTTVSIGDSDISYIALFSSDDSSSSSSSTVSVSDTIEDISDALTELNTTFTKITDDVDTIATLTEVVATVISEAIESGNYDSDYIAEAVSTAVSEAILSGMIDSAKLLVESDTASTMISSAISSIDFAAVANAVTESNNVALTSSQIQLAALYAQYEIYALEADDTVLTAQEDAVDAAKTALDALKEEQEELENGWKASFDGTITSVDIVSGGQTTALSTAITLENLNQLVATISLGEYDVHKVKVGMPAVITTAYGTYDGEVATIAPVATGGSESSLLDSVGSMAGISGLSSLTESGAGVECTVTISGADENIIPGFDADVEISTGEYLGVTVVPIESITLEKTGSYVYLYDEEEGTVTKTLIETGATSDSAYEVTSGLQVGDRIIAAPQSDYEEDTFEIKVVE